ncbi:class I SAM-dependent methyltransferase [Marinicrinis sediminis]|uniref:Class I SAM-dependent methyltransferase n=1 Tax=Marinicrinis sediminis TaxID=1652465 RepID=A0ABW5RCX0_9BACL
MSEHYYTAKPSTEHQTRWIEEEIRGVRMSFMTDRGVFSKGGIDFGSRLLIETMQIPDQSRLLDVGCGYGPIGLFAQKLNATCQVTMIDINERALQLAATNAARNGLDQVRIHQSDQLSAVQDQKFDMIVTNPPIRAGKQVVHGIFESAHACLNKGGTLWIVIQKKQGAPSAQAKLQDLFDEVEELTKDKGYRIYRAVK